MSLQDIKNDYAKTKHYKHWNELLLNNDSFTVGNLHLNAVMKIYARECLKLASENAEVNCFDGTAWLETESITNENNIIK